MEQIKLADDRTSSLPILAFGTTVIGVPLLITAVRCTLQYILVPFVLPLFSVSGTFSPIVNILASVFGLCVILYNLASLWRTNWRKRYILLSSFIIPVILVSIYFDYLYFLSI